MDQDRYEIRVPKLELRMTAGTHYYSAHVSEGQNLKGVSSHLFGVLFDLFWVEYNIAEASWERPLSYEKVMDIQ